MKVLEYSSICVFAAVLPSAVNECTSVFSSHFTSCPTKALIRIRRSVLNLAPGEGITLLSLLRVFHYCYYVMSWQNKRNSSVPAHRRTKSACSMSSASRTYEMTLAHTHTDTHTGSRPIETRCRLSDNECSCSKFCVESRTAINCPAERTTMSVEVNCHLQRGLLVHFVPRRWGCAEWGNSADRVWMWALERDGDSRKAHHFWKNVDVTIKVQLRWNLVNSMS